ncbi:MAG: hypothetical protein WBO18_03900 [Gammaproteobacteria bacterium]
MINPQAEPAIADLPAYVQSWSAVKLPGFVTAVLDNWRRNFGELPDSFSLVACPQAEINANGGLPGRVIELTDSRVRIKQFTSCHRLYLVILIMGQDAEERREQIQQYLSWSEGYDVEIHNGVPQLRFVEAVEECELN